MSRGSAVEGSWGLVAFGLADLGLPVTPERPLTKVERELIRTASARLRAGEAGSPAVLEDYHPLMSEEIAQMLEGFLHPATAPPEAVDAARELRRRLDR